MCLNARPSMTPTSSTTWFSTIACSTRSPREKRSRCPRVRKRRRWQSAGMPPEKPARPVRRYPTSTKRRLPAGAPGRLPFSTSPVRSRGRTRLWNAPWMQTTQRSAYRWHAIWLLLMASHFQP